MRTKNDYKIIEGVAFITLTQGQVALIDEEDLERTAQHRWRAEKHYKTWYSRTTERKSQGRRKNTMLHRLIMRATTGTEIDHINGNGLDNRKANLRFVSHSQNQANRRQHTVSGLKGASFNRRFTKWQARIKTNGKSISLGYFNNAEAAARAYDAKAREVFGEYACLNFSEASKRA